MNIVYLHTHDLGRFIQPYGFPFPAPTVQQLAEEGILFRQAFSAAPSCSPSRAGLLTGQYPHQCGMNGLASPYIGYRLNDYSRHLAAHLRTNGYETAIAGVHHIGNLPWIDPAKDLPYDRFLDHRTPLMNTNRMIVAQKAAEFLAEKHEKPFFLACGFGVTHHSQWERNYEETRDSMGTIDHRYIRPLPRHPDNEVARKETALFKRSVEILDLQFKTVLDAIDRNGLRHDTLVICTTDHGPGLPDVKCQLKDDGTGVMLIIRGPKGFDGGHVVDAMVSHLDIYPSICELLDHEPPPWLEGTSFLPLVNGTGEKVHEEIFTELGYHGPAKPQRGVRTERYKFIRYFGAPVSFSYMDADGGMIHDYLNQLGRNRIPFPEEQLYDLAMDPIEINNLAHDPRYADVKMELSRKLDTWMTDTNDPILRGGVPRPPALEDPGYLDRLISVLSDNGYTLDREAASRNCKKAIQEMLKEYS